MEQNLIKNILGVLSKHPEGLTISSLAHKAGVHRHTVTKYVKDLILSGKVEERKVGMAKLCFLSKYKPAHTVASDKAETGQVQVFLLTLILMAIPVLIIAQNIDNSSDIMTGDFPVIFDTLTVTSSSDIISTTTSFEYVQNSTVQDNENLTTTTLISIQNSTVQDNEIINITQDDFANNSESSSKVDENLTLTDNQTLENQTVSTENQSNDVTTTTDYTINEPIKVEIDYNSKVTRGNVLSVNAKITNNMNALKKISYEWLIPSDLNGLSPITGECELDFNQTCDVEFLLDTSSSDLGIKQIKIVVRYE